MAKRVRKSLAFLLAAIMLLSCLGVTALASGESGYQLGDVVIGETQPEAVEGAHWRREDVAAVRGKLLCEEAEHSHSDVTGDCYQRTCTTEEHWHSGACIGLTCGLEEHSHRNSRCRRQYTCGHKRDWEHNWKCSREYTCGKEEHEHTADCYGYICGLAEHSHSTGCYSLTCTETEHQHSDACYEILEPAYTQWVLEAHTWDDGQVVTEATDTTGATTRYTCTVCYETKDVTEDKIISAKVYYRYNNEIPERINGNYDAGDFGPSGDDTPAVTVQVNLTKLMASTGMKPYTNEYGHIYYSVENPGSTFVDGKEGAKALWLKIEEAMDESDTVALDNYFGDNNFIGYVLKKENVGWHIDGILDQDPPVYVVELYDNDVFFKSMSKHTDSAAKAIRYNEVQDEIEAHVGVTDGTWSKTAGSKVDNVYTYTAADGRTIRVTASFFEDSSVKANGMINYKEITSGVYYVACVNIVSEDITVYTDYSVKAAYYSDGSLDGQKDLYSSGNVVSIPSTAEVEAAYSAANTDYNGNGYSYSSIAYNERERCFILRYDRKTAQDYSVEYYFEQTPNKGDYQLDISLTKSGKIQAGETITAESQKLASVPAGYSFEKAEPASISYDSAGKVLKLYYTKDMTYTQVIAAKDWVDGEPAASITLELLADGQVQDSKTISGTENWTCSFTSLLEYDGNGNKITYTVRESAVSGAQLDSNGRFIVYGSAVTAEGEQEVTGFWTASAEDGSIVNTWHPAENLGTGSLQIRKQDDSGNALAGVTFALTGSGQSLTAVTDADGAARFDRLSTGSYTLTETFPTAQNGHYEGTGSWTVNVTESGKILLDVAENNNIFQNIWSWITGVQTNGTDTFADGILTVVNTYVYEPSHTDNGKLTVTKTVSGHALPDNFQIVVTNGQNETVATLTLNDARGDGTENSPYTWGLEGLPAGTYNAAEENAQVKGYTLTATGRTQTVLETQTADNGDTTVSSGSIALQNSYQQNGGGEVIVTSYTLTVNWVDEEGNALAPQLRERRLAGSAYDTQQKSFDGYSFKEMAAGSDLVSGIMDGNKTVTYVYSAEHEIDDPDVPLDPEPTEPGDGDTEIDDPDVPLDPAPDLPDGETVIDDEDVPLAPGPQTGDNSALALLIGLMVLSGTGLAVLLLGKKKGKKSTK